MGCNALQKLNVSNFNTSNVINMGHMFQECSSLIDLDISNFNTSKVTNMSYEDIGAEFKKHHSTVMYNIDQIEKDIETDTKLARQINDIISNAKSIQ